MLRFMHLEQPYERVATQGSLVGLVCGFCAGDVWDYQATNFLHLIMVLVW